MHISSLFHSFPSNRFRLMPKLLHMLTLLAPLAIMQKKLPSGGENRRGQMYMGFILTSRFY